MMLLKTKTPVNSGVKFTKSFLPQSSEVRLVSSLSGPLSMATYKILARHSAPDKLHTWGLEKTEGTSLSLGWYSQFTTAGFANQSPGLLPSFSPKLSFLLSLGREFSPSRKHLIAHGTFLPKVQKKPKLSSFFLSTERQVITWVYKMFLTAITVIIGKAELLWAVSTGCGSTVPT